MTSSAGEKIGELNGTLKTFMETSKAQHAAASESRQRIFEKLDDINDQLATLSNNDNSHDARLGRIEPVAADFSIWKQRFIGMAMIVTLVSSSVAAGVTFFLKKWFLTP